MKSIYLTTIAFLLLLSSCTSYYYSTMKSNDPFVEQDNYGDFIAETDSVQVVYSFYGENAPVSISIYNKSDQGLQVNWQRSSLVINNIANSYKGSSFTFDGSSQGVNTWGGRSDTFVGSGNLPEHTSFIPPKSKIERTSLELVNLPYQQIPKRSYRRFNLVTMNNEPVDVQVVDFTETDSPLQLRSYLTLVFNQGSEQVLEQRFFVSRVVKTKNVPPTSFSEGRERRGDFFYVREVKGSEAGAAAGVLTAIVVSAAFEVAVDTAVANMKGEKTENQALLADRGANVHARYMNHEQHSCVERGEESNLIINRFN